jgi:repressor LexA
MSAGDEVRKRILRFITQYQLDHGHPPAIRDIGRAVGIESTGHVAYHLAVLEKQGVLTHQPRISRSLQPTRPSGPLLRGRIAAGAPLELFDPGECDVLDLGELTLTGGVTRDENSAIYAVQVRGDSMIEDGILNGDYVLIDPDGDVRHGVIAVAIHKIANGGRGAATLKRIVRKVDGVLLQPDNAVYTPQFIPAKEWDRDWDVKGTVVAICRRCNT